MSYFLVGVLVLLSGIFSGLTLGFFSINLTSLERKVKLRDKRAIMIYPIRKNGNLLLCTLLLGNVAVNSTMAIFLGEISTGIMAGLISTGLIVIFGEIIPQAAFSRYALTVGAYSIWLVRFFIFIFYPIAYPLSWGLDKILGKELPTIWNKREIKEIIRAHERAKDSDIDEDEERIMIGALSFSDKNIENIMTPKGVVYSLSSNAKITTELLKEIKEKGFTRIPVFNENPFNVSNVMFTKDLIGYSGTENKTIKDFIKYDKVLSVRNIMKLDSLLNHFINTKKHLAIVYDSYGSYTGIVTLEDVIEEILNKEIVDEADTSENMQTLAMQQNKKDILDN